MSSSAVHVRLSQESLFFPLPFTDASIENVVQITNELPNTKDKPRDHVIAYKVLSMARHRYSVHPPVGFIPASGAVTIKFILDPHLIRSSKDPALRVLPDKDTRDAVFIDFAIVSDGSEYLRKWDTSKPHNSMDNGVIDDANSFWKKHGSAQVKGQPPIPSASRKMLKCIFTEKDRVPQSLVMKMQQNDGGKPTVPAAHATVVSPSSRAPPSPGADATRQAPPESLPARGGGGSLNVVPPSSSGASTSSKGLAPAAAPPVQTIREAMMAARSKLILDQYKEEKPKSMLSMVMNYRIPFVIAVMLVVAAMLCGMFEKNSLFSRIIAGK